MALASLAQPNVSAFPNERSRGKVCESRHYHRANKNSIAGTAAQCKFAARGGERLAQMRPWCDLYRSCRCHLIRLQLILTSCRALPTLATTSSSSFVITRKPTTMRKNLKRHTTIDRALHLETKSDTFHLPHWRSATSQLGIFLRQ